MRVWMRDKRLYGLVFIACFFFVIRSIVAYKRSIIRSLAPPPFQASPYVRDINADSEGTAIHQSNKARVVFYAANDCLLTQRLMGVFLEAASSSSGIEWYRVNTKTCPGLQKEAQVTSTPSLLYAQSGPLVKFTAPMKTKALAALVTRLNAPELLESDFSS